MKTNLYPTLCILIAVVYVSTSCGPVMYSATGQNTPMFSQAKEFSATVASSASYNDWSILGGSSTEGFAAQAAYAVNDKWAVLGSLYTFNESNSGSDYWTGKGGYQELGYGHYKKLPSAPVAYEFFGGVGFGSIKSSKDREYVNARFTKVFVQPSVGLITRYFDLIITPRISYLNFGKEDYNLQQANRAQEMRQFYANHKSKLLLEPGLTLRVGYQFVKLQYQYNYSGFKADDANGYLPVNKEFGSLGLYFLISSRYAKAGRN